MADQTKIQWTGATWNPVTGCTKVSAGCKNCYMFREYPRLARLGVKGYAGGSPDLVRCWPERLGEPLHWKKPRRVFVNSMSDLFHESIPEEFIDRVWAVMALTPHHTFQILTKRPERMLHYLDAHRGEKMRYERVLMEADALRADHAKLHLSSIAVGNPVLWPLPNVWLGVSVEDQKTANERIPLLLQTPTAVRFISYEPALGPADFTQIKCVGAGFMNALTGEDAEDHGMVSDGLDWVICGGESGPDARPMHPDWARSVRDQCVAAGVPYFMKQMHIDGKLVKEIDQFPADLRLRQYPRNERDGSGERSNA